MLIASWPLHDFAGFLQIISWITLPVLIIAVSITLLMHYYQRSRRKKEEGSQKGYEQNAALPDANISYNQARYRALKTDFETLQQMYYANEGELSLLGAEMKRQDQVIDALRRDVTSLEKHLLNLRLALQLKEEQLHAINRLLEEKHGGIHTTLYQA
jgi:chromosome segregation ATPase